MAPLRAACRALVGHLGGVDAVVLVDGGTDILTRGDEHGLGTPEEDMASPGAVSGLDEVPERLVACLGFGDSREGALHLDAVAHAQRATPTRPSIVNGSVAAAVRGEFGDVRFTDRTRDGELFVNPPVALYFCVVAVGLARRDLYLDRPEKTELTRQISSVVAEFRDELPPAASAARLPALTTGNR